MLAFRALFCAGALCLAAPAFAADTFSSDWAAGLKSSARLILGDAENGRFHAGIEIKLAPGAITYWRNPGDAGLPPTLNFDGSANLADARAFFPAPQRLNEGDGAAFGYDHSVILPLDVQAADPGKPVTLALKLDYAVCEKICVPARAELRLRLAKDEGASPYAAAVAKARAEVPRPVDWAKLAGKATLASAGDKAWRLCFASPQPSARQLFVEAPPPWWFAVAREAASPQDQSCFRVTLEQKPEDQNLPVAARFTVTGGNGAFETTATLGAPASQ